MSFFNSANVPAPEGNTEPKQNRTPFSSSGSGSLPIDKTSSFTAFFANKPSTQQNPSQQPTLSNGSTFPSKGPAVMNRQKRGREDEEPQVDEDTGEEEEEGDDEEWEDIDEEEDEDEELEGEEDEAEEGEDSEELSDDAEGDEEEEVDEIENNSGEEELEVQEEILIIEEPVTDTGSEASPQFSAEINPPAPPRLESEQEGDTEDVPWGSSPGSNSFAGGTTFGGVPSNPFGSTAAGGSNPFSSKTSTISLGGGMNQTKSVNPFAFQSQPPQGSSFGKSTGSAAKSIPNPLGFVPMGGATPRPVQNDAAVTPTNTLDTSTNGGFLKPLPLAKKSPNQSPLQASPLNDPLVGGRGQGETGRGRGGRGAASFASNNVDKDMDQYLSRPGRGRGGREPTRQQQASAQPAQLDTKAVLLNMPSLPSPTLGAQDISQLLLKKADEPISEEQYQKYIQPIGFRDYDSEFPYNEEETLRQQAGLSDFQSVGELMERRVPSGKYDQQLQEMLNK